MGEDVWLPRTVTSAVYGGGVMLSLVVLVALCVCRGKRRKNSSVTQETEINIRLQELGNDKQTCTQQTEDAIRDSNGVAITTDDMENGRPVCHDHRALPEIPKEGIMQTDDEEEDDGHYDIIPKKGKKKAAGNHKGKCKGHNPYEKVKGEEPDSASSTYAAVSSDSNYAGVKETNEPEAKVCDLDPPYAGVDDDNEPNYAGVDDDAECGATGGEPELPGEADYALIDEAKRTRDVRSIWRPKSQDTLGSYSSMPAPPVPDKLFDDPEVASDGIGAVSGGDLQTQLNNVPVSPPADQVDGMMSQPHFANPGLPPDVSLIPVNGANIVTVNDSAPNGVISTEMASEKREPPYSSVTARESLENIRQRQAVQRNTDIDEVMYETVNYDLIKTGNSDDVSDVKKDDRVSLVSDLYAEIPSTNGIGSTRSSMYARVGDTGSNAHAPTPPPLDTLRQLSHLEDDYPPEPGYSRIGRVRPQSVLSSSSAARESRTAIREPVYAVVDKSKKTNNRRTIHVDSKVERSLEGETPLVDNLYAKVNKPTPFTNNIPYMAGEGARPKVKPLAQGHPSMFDNIDPPEVDYQTIGSVQEFCIDGSGVDVNIVALPENGPEMKDPNYESMDASVLDNSGGVVLQGPSPPGVAQAIDPNGNPAMKLFDKHEVVKSRLKTREHIYMEINESGMMANSGKKKGKKSKRKA